MKDFVDEAHDRDEVALHYVAGVSCRAVCVGASWEATGVSYAEGESGGAVSYMKNFD